MSLPRIALALVLVVALAPALHADEPRPGAETRVECQGYPGQSYACYVPKAYDKRRPWPILYCFSPNAGGDVFVQRYRAVCEERGWIVVGSMNSRNGPWEPIQAAVDAMWADAEKRFNLSASMRYTTGFSGGARVAFAVARMHPEEVSGVIAIGAGLPDRNQPQKALAAYLTCGETDPNKRELDPLFETLEAAGNPVRYRNFPGGHVMPPVEILEEAVRWLDDLAPAKRAAAFAAAVDEASALAGAEKPLDAYVLIRTALGDDAYAEVKERRKDAEALLKSLARDPLVKPEVAAFKKLTVFEAWWEKNAEKALVFDHVNKQAAKKLAAIVDKYADTPSGRAAAKRLEELPAIDK